MAISGFDVALFHLILFALAAVYRSGRDFAARRLSAAELLEQTRLVRFLIARALRGTWATKEDVKELTQDVLLAAWEASEEDRYRPDPDVQPSRALQGWLRKLAYHHVSHHLEAARMQREELVADPSDVERGPSAEQAIEREQMRLAVIEALRQLPEQQGAAIAGHDIDEMPMEELAAELGAPPSTVYRWRARGIAALAKALRPVRR
jgi:RNA polymerase sigma-70 factor (ECF subfamily)